MEALIEIARHVLNERGAMEARALATECLRLPHRSAVPAHLMKAAARLVAQAPGADHSAFLLVRAALAERDGLAVSSFPAYRLRQRKRPESLHSIGWLASAYDTLSLSPEPVAFSELYDAIVRTARFRFSPGNPRYQLYLALMRRGRSFIMQSGQLCIGLNEHHTSTIPSQPTARREPKIPSASGVHNIHKTHLGSVMAEDLDAVEPGLTLIGRQSQAPPVRKSMKSWFDVAIDVLKERGPIEIFRLIDAAEKRKRVQVDPHQLGVQLFQFAKWNQRGLTVAEYPAFRLKSSTPPRGRRMATAFKVLCLSRDYMDIRTIIEKASAAGLRGLEGSPALPASMSTVPEFWLYEDLTYNRSVFSQRGALKIGLASISDIRTESDKPSRTRLEQNIHEVRLKALAAQDPDRANPGLELVGRQDQAPPVRRTDLSCGDTPGVIETEKFRETTEAEASSFQPAPGASTFESQYSLVTRETHETWIDRLLQSPILQERLQQAGRVALPPEKLRGFLQALDERGGTILRGALAQKLGEPGLRMPGIIAAMRRILNVEGYAVSVDNASGSVVLNRQLLEVQFELNRVENDNGWLPPPSQDH